MRKLIILLFLLLLIGCVNQPSEKKYTITFVAGDEIISTISVVTNEEVTFPTPPEISGYTFSHWDYDIETVDQDLVVTAIYTKNDIYYQVKFMADGSILQEFSVKAGESVNAPTAPEKEGYRFKGWDKSFNVINNDLIINAIYEEIAYYEVKFVDGDVVLKSELVERGKDASAPVPPVKSGYNFTGWSKTFTNIQSNLTISPLYEEIKNPPVDNRINYASFIDSFTYPSLSSPKDLIGTVLNSTHLKATITNIHYGGFRNTDFIVYYDASNVVSRNQYGFEIAIDKDGLVVDKNTNVTLPAGGAVLSAHGSGIDKIKNINIGDIIVFNKTDLNVKVYSYSVIGLYIKIMDIIPRIEEAMGKYLALDYAGIEVKVNQAIDLYEGLLASFKQTNVDKAEELLLELEFMLVEGRAVQTKAFWHYPTRSTGYPETNQQEVEALLDKIKEMGFNNIYLNTNMDGRAIYKSKYLQQKMTGSYTYGTYKDYLECFISEAHKRGIKVTAWTNTLIAGDGSSNAFYNNWLQKGINGENNQGGMYFIDISNPDAQVFLKNVFQELAGDYMLDGIEFDFIRFPSGNISTKTGDISSQTGLSDWGYTETFIEGFKKVNPFTGDFKTKVLKEETFRNQWMEYKRAFLSDFVKELVTTIRSARQTITMCAAVMSNITSARNTYLQDWQYWVEQGWIDVLDPMIYNADNNYVLGQVKNMYELIKGKAFIVAGLFPETNGGLSSANAQQISLITENYQVGWAKFSSRVIFNSKTLMAGYVQMNRSYTVVEQASKDEIFHAYIYDLLDKIENYYKYADALTNYDTLITILANAYKLTTYDSNVLNNINTELNKINNSVIKARLLKQYNNIKIFLN